MGDYNPVPEEGTRVHSGFRHRVSVVLDLSVSEAIINNGGETTNVAMWTPEWSRLKQTMLENTFAVRLKDSYKQSMGLNETVTAGVNNATDYINVFTNYARLPVPKNTAMLIPVEGKTKAERVRAYCDEILRSVVPIGVIQRTFWTGRADSENTPRDNGTICDYVCYNTLSLPVDSGELRPWEPVCLSISTEDGGDGRFTLKNIASDDIAESVRKCVESYTALLTKTDAVNFESVFDNGGAGNMYPTGNRPIFGQSEEIGQKFLLGVLCASSKVIRMLQSGIKDKNGNEIIATNLSEALEVLEKMVQPVNKGGNVAKAAPVFLNQMVKESINAAFPQHSFTLELNSIDMIAQAVAEEVYRHKSIGVVVREVEKTPQSGIYHRYDTITTVV